MPQGFLSGCPFCNVLYINVEIEMIDIVVHPTLEWDIVLYSKSTYSLKKKCPLPLNSVVN